MAGVGRRKLGFSRTKSPYKNVVANPQYVLLSYCGPVVFVAALSITLIIPFYSTEVEVRGAFLQINGLVFGIYQLVVVSASPIVGKLIINIGPASVLNNSLIVSILGLVAFGLLERISTESPFLLLSFVFRIVQAVGCAGIFAACTVLVSAESKKYPTTNFAALQTFVALGISLGPSLGEALYEHRGFHEPFFVLGGCLLLARLISRVPLSYTTSFEKPTDPQNTNVLSLLKLPSIALCSLGMLSTAASLGFICACLKLHLEQFLLPTSALGAILALNGFVYVVTVPIWGYVCDKFGQCGVIQFISNLLIFIAFLIIGPAPFIPIQSQVWLIVTGLIFQGLAFGSCFMSTFSTALKDSRKNGFPDNTSTYALVATLWQALISLGVWLGATVCGAIVDYFGFPDSSWLFLITSLTMTCSTGFYILTGLTRRSKDALLRYRAEVVQFTKAREQVASYGVVHQGNSRKNEFSRDYVL